MRGGAEETGCGFLNGAFIGPRGASVQFGGSDEVDNEDLEVGSEEERALAAGNCAIIVGL